eukprot:TRINITY_DN12374_c0_g1_i1.p1 TRINITY_DN12374_c0_g1~~TRINITY_DN12374_c0_g1_i1.p1  ORF type:complete len:365 (-),score=65.05 TRINITY_DN12374_c0_g1_i1:38-1039(-)
MFPSNSLSMAVVVVLLFLFGLVLDVQSAAVPQVSLYGISYQGSTSNTIINSFTKVLYSADGNFTETSDNVTITVPAFFLNGWTTKPVVSFQDGVIYVVTVGQTMNNGINNTLWTIDTSTGSNQIKAQKITITPRSMLTTSAGDVYILHNPIFSSTPPLLYRMTETGQFIQVATLRAGTNSITYDEKRSLFWCADQVNSSSWEIYTLDMSGRKRTVRPSNYDPTMPIHSIHFSVVLDALVYIATPAGITSPYVATVDMATLTVAKRYSFDYWGATMSYESILVEDGVGSYLYGLVTSNGAGKLGVYDLKANALVMAVKPIPFFYNIYSASIVSN